MFASTRGVVPSTRSCDVSSSCSNAARDDRLERSSGRSSEPRINSSRNGNGSGRPGWATRTTCAPSSASARPVRGAAHVEPSTTTRAPSSTRRADRATAPAVQPRAQFAPPPPGASRHPPRHRPLRPELREVTAQRPHHRLEVGPGRRRARVHPAVGGAQQTAGAAAGRPRRPAGRSNGMPSASHSSPAARRATATPGSRLTMALIPPSNSGARFSKKAAMPSARSRVVESNRFRSDSSRCPSAIVRSRPRGGRPRVPPLARVARRPRAARRASPRRTSASSARNAMPLRSSWSASIASPITSMRNASATPPARVSRCVPPQHGSSPAPTSGNAIVACSPTTRMSAASSSSAPAPIAGPFHTAIVGAERRPTERQDRQAHAASERAARPCRRPRRVEQDGARRIDRALRQRRDQLRAGGHADVGQRAGCERDGDDARSTRSAHVNRRRWRARPPRRARRR